MFTRNDLLASVASLVLVLADEPEGAPESILYMAVGCDLELTRLTVALCKSAGWITVQNNYVEITDAGKAKAKQLREVI